MQAQNPGDAEEYLDPERKERERDFHDKRFASENRESLSAYYAVLAASTSFFEAVTLSRAKGSAVLDFGCGRGTYSVQLAKQAKRVVGIDLSPVAIEQARERARELGISNAEFQVADAESLEFPDETFDLVCGRAILHHLNLPTALRGIARVLKPSGAAVFYEPLGHNPILNLYRRLTPGLRTPDEHPLTMTDLALARRYFWTAGFRPFALTTPAAKVVSGTRLFSPVVRLLEKVDGLIFRLAFMRRHAWTSIWVLEGPRRVPEIQAERAPAEA